MTNSFQTIILFAAPLCFLSFITIAQSQVPRDHFIVQGDVYCDTCRAQFMTRLSKPMPRAKVRLECRHLNTAHVAYTVDGETDENGAYALPVDGDHADDICEVGLVQSSMPECDEIPDNGWSKESSRIVLTANDGMVDPVRRANPLFYLKKQALPECIEVFKELNYLPTDN